MNIPKVIVVKSETYWVLNIKNNIYGKSQKGIVRNKFLVGKLTSTAFRLRKINIYEFVFYWLKIIHILYIDDSIMYVPD